MSLFRNKFTVAALAALLIGTSVAPSQAFTPVPAAAERSSDIQQVQARESWRDRDGRRWSNVDREVWRKRGYHRRGNAYYYNGHRGYRYARPGYRRHNDAWFPLAAFGAGAIIGGALADRPRVYVDPPVRRVGNSHVEWCMNRYRTYRASDNSYVPRAGYRAQCVSPYS
ncbi:BA14K family protein [Ensifer soli]|uniref:BA14K family protein n=1 Tax=Ciceribacter sp. sgz301302 TaxID=3342379 RepID=UPI0035BA53BC